LSDADRSRVRVSADALSFMATLELNGYLRWLITVPSDVRVTV